MMGKQIPRGRVSQSIAVFFAMLGLTACAMAQKPYPEKPATTSVREITLQIAEDGSISVKGGVGAIIDETCSLDPDAKDACPIYQKDKRIQVERIEPIVLMKYQVNPICYLVGQYSQARLICYP